MRVLHILGMLATLMIAAGCDGTEPGGFESEIVVEAYLQAGEIMPDVRISRTLPLEATYNEEDAAVEDAQVIVRLLDEAGSVEEVYEYRERRIAGLYFPAFVTGARRLVEPLRTYELLVELPDHPQTIRARTTVPDTFSVRSQTADSVIYQASDQFTFLVSRSSYPGRQNVFLFTTYALDGRSDQLTPFALGLIRNSDLEVEDLRERASPTLNEENFDRVDGDLLLIRFPWLAVYFYGRNEIAVSALDDNLFDFIRSQSVQQGGSTLPPGEIPNVLEHVDGARGVFGSYSRATISLYVLRPTPGQETAAGGVGP